MDDKDGRELRLKADMDVALERSCALLRLAQDTHENRAFIAKKIIECVHFEHLSLSDLTEAGRQAVGLLNALKPIGQGGGTLA